MDRLAILAMVFCMIGCAQLPNVRYDYYPAKAKTTLTVTQVFDCDADKHVTVYYSPAPTAKTDYFRDPESKPHSLTTESLRSAFADTDVGLSWFDDGRLKTINATTTGQGEAVVKAVIGVVTALGGGSPRTKVKCADVKELAAGKPVTVSYEATIDYSTEPLGGLGGMKATASSTDLHTRLVMALAGAFPNVKISLDSSQPIEPNVTNLGNASAAKITLNTQYVYHLSISDGTSTLWSGAVNAPTAATYELPIPKPRPFGKQVFTLTLNESGAIVAQGYGRAVGTAAAANAFAAGYAAVEPPDQTRANAIKAEADVIAQTARLAACRKDPGTCK